MAHAVLFNDGVNDECGNVKRIVDVTWIMQPDEGYAETVAKAVGYIFNPLRASMDFEKLKKRTLCQGWLPPVKQRGALLQDMVKELLVHNIRAVKRDKRSQTGCVSYENWMKHSARNAMPYGQY